MKKVFALILALVLCLSLSVTAFAANGDDDNSTWTSEATTITATKEYTVNGGDSTVYPAETISFDVTADDSNPDATAITVDDVTASGTSNDITINIPSYSKVGVYTYTIKEKAGDTQGVTYDTDTEISVSVLVSYDYENKSLKAEAGVTSVNDEKQDTITNDYDLGTLEVTKTVTGNLGDKSKAFDVTVTFTAESGKSVYSDITYTDDGKDKTITGNGWTGSEDVTITLKDSETVTFNNIPAGISYVVKEVEENQDGYTTTYSNDTGDITQNCDITATITNDKEVSVDTGITLDSLPYVILGVAVVAGLAAVLVNKKRRSGED